MRFRMMPLLKQETGMSQGLNSSIKPPAYNPIVTPAQAGGPSIKLHHGFRLSLE